MPTFTDIGLDFPLFQGLVEDAILEEPGVCSRCAATAPLLLAKKCYDCFRASGHKMNTEYGMVRPEDARAGVTHGVPLDPKRLPDLPLVAHPIDPAFPDEHWYSVKCDPQDLEELTRTPKYHTWQGEQWLFCCGKPAVFAGTLNSRSLADHRRMLELVREKKVKQLQGLLVTHIAHTRQWYLEVLGDGPAEADLSA